MKQACVGTMAASAIPSIATHPNPSVGCSSATMHGCTATAAARLLSSKTTRPAFRQKNKPHHRLVANNDHHSPLNGLTLIALYSIYTLAGRRSVSQNAGAFGHVNPSYFD